MSISVRRARELLGSEAHGKTDEQAQRIVDEVSSFARLMCDFVHDAWKRDPDAVRSLAQASAASRKWRAEGQRSRSEAAEDVLSPS